MTRPEPFRGGGSLLAGGLVAGVVGLAGSAIGWGVDTRRALYAWLFAWAYWGGMAAASLVLLGIWHASRARWPVVLRRVLEVQAGTLPLLAVLFLPVGIGVARLYPFARPQGFEEQVRVALRHQGPYMNVPFWAGRAALYFVVWIAVSELLLRWSRAQDEDGALAWTRRQRWLGAGTLPLVALLLSFAALDWLMALEPLFNSTIFALYWFMGSLLGAVALLALSAAWARGEARVGDAANASHRASLGKLLLGFTLFWVYVAFVQWLLTWIADLPREARWYLARTTGGWWWVAIAVVLAQFAVPFLLLLSRGLKESRAGLAVASLWILGAHAVDAYWIVLPAHDAGPAFSWMDAAAFVAIGGLGCAFAVLRLRGHSPVPVRDPYHLESLRYAGK